MHKCHQTFFVSGLLAASLLLLFTPLTTHAHDTERLKQAIANTLDSVVKIVVSKSQPSPPASVCHSRASCKQIDFRQGLSWHDCKFVTSPIGVFEQRTMHLSVTRVSSDIHRIPIRVPIFSGLSHAKTFHLSSTCQQSFTNVASATISCVHCVGFIC